MRFTVVWQSPAEVELARLWNNATGPLRDAIRLAADQIDRILGQAPDTAGESRENAFKRMFFVRPLAVHYEVMMQDRIVKVLSVHLLPQVPEGE